MCDEMYSLRVHQSIIQKYANRTCACVRACVCVKLGGGQTPFKILVDQDFKRRLRQCDVLMKRHLSDPL